MSIFSDIYRVLTLTCDESARLASDSLDRRLTLAERIALRAHTSICRSCRRFMRQIGFLRQAARRAGEDQSALSAEARARIKAALKAKQGEV